MPPSSPSATSAMSSSSSSNPTATGSTGGEGRGGVKDAEAGVGERVGARASEWQAVPHPGKGKPQQQRPQEEEEDRLHALHEAARAGHVPAIVGLAQVQHDGLPGLLPPDAERARATLRDLLRWVPDGRILGLLATWEAEWEREEAPAKQQSQCSEDGDGGEEDDEHPLPPSLALWRRAADEFASLPAMHQVARGMLERGRPRLALAYWQRAAELGDVQAMRCIVTHCQGVLAAGQHVTRGDEQAETEDLLARTLDQLTQRRDARALYWRGQCHLEGRHHHPHNPLLALDYLHQAVQGGEEQALPPLTALLLQGAPGVPVDASLGLAFGARCARLGLQPSFHALATFCLDQGRGELAAAYYRQAIEQDGCVEAYLPLAHLLLHGGHGCRKDEVNALEYLHQAWHVGQEAQALPPLMAAYAYGRGTPVDMGQALELYQAWATARTADGASSDEGPPPPASVTAHELLDLLSSGNL